MASRNNWNRSQYRVNVCEGFRQFADTWQTAVQNFFTKVIELQHYVVAIRTATVARDDFLNHRASDYVTTCKVFGVRSITLHETLAVLVDQVSTFTTATFGNQYTGAGNTGRVELPHFDAAIRRVSTNYMRASAYATMGIIQWLSLATKQATPLIAVAVLMTICALCYLAAGIKGQAFVGSKTLGGAGIAQMIV